MLGAFLQGRKPARSLSFFMLTLLRIQRISQVKIFSSFSIESEQNQQALFQSAKFLLEVSVDSGDGRSQRC